MRPGTFGLGGSVPSAGGGAPAIHTHESNPQGGTLDEDALATTDVTTGNATTSKHGFLKKLSNVASEFMNGVGNWVAVSWDDLTDKPTLPTYTITNDVVDRAYDANATTVDELADVLGTLIDDLGAAGMGGSPTVLLEQHTASASATLDFTSFISATYDEYLIELIQILPATNAADLLFRVGTGAGPTYQSGASDYAYAAFRFSAAGTANDGSAATSSINLTGNGAPTNTAANGGISGSFRLFNPGGGTAHPRIVGECGFDDGNAFPDVHTQVTGRYLATTAVTAIRFLMESGNIASGTIRIYGVAK